MWHWTIAQYYKYRWICIVVVQGKHNFTIEKGSLSIPPSALGSPGKSTIVMGYVSLCWRIVYWETLYLNDVHKLLRKC